MSKQVEIGSIPAVYLSAITNKDLDGIMSLYADNAVVEDPIGSEPYVGIDAIRAFYASVMDFGLSAELTGQVHVAANEVAFPFRCENPAGGIVMNVIDVFKFDNDGKIVLMRAFWGKDNLEAL